MSGDWLREAMVTLADEYGPPSVDLHAAAVRTAERTTRRRAVVAGAVLTVLVSVGALLAFSPSVGPGRTPAATPTTSPTAAPSPEVRSDLSRIGSTVDVPRGAIDLANATLELPQLGYASPWCVGSVRFSAYQNKHAGDTIEITREWAGDVDRNGTVDTVAMVVCERGELRNWQVIAVTAAGSGVRLLGQVIAIGPRPAPASLFALRLLPGGEVVAEVGDYLGTYGDDAARVSTHQERTYGWDGSRFAQIGGPTQFPTNPHLFDIRLTGALLSFGPPKGNTRTGTLNVTGTNAGPGPTGQVAMYFSYPAAATPGAGWEHCTQHAVEEGLRGAQCALPDLAVGESFTITLELTAPASLRAPAGPYKPSVDVVGHDAMGYGYILDASVNHKEITVQLE